jgi:hypothetical protein
VGLDQAPEDLIEAVVVADGRQVRAVGGEGERGQRGTFAVEAARELRSEVLGVGGRSAVPEREHLATATQRLDQQLGRQRDRVATGVEGGELHGSAGLEAAAHSIPADARVVGVAHPSAPRWPQATELRRNPEETQGDRRPDSDPLRSPVP